MPNQGVDRNIWDENVEKIILALSLRKNYSNSNIGFGYVKGIEPFTYAQEIFEHYNYYKQFIEEKYWF